METTMTTTQIGHAVICELERAYAKHGKAQWGRHEFYAILKEEVDELWDAIKDDAPHKKVEVEAIQIAAMVFRYLETGDRYAPKQ
jgi:N-acetylglucosamine kinase-like BadF-type ATPase